MSILSKLDLLAPDRLYVFLKKFLKDISHITKQSKIYDCEKAFSSKPKENLQSIEEMQLGDIFIEGSIKVRTH